MKGQGLAIAAIAGLGVWVLSKRAQASTIYGDALGETVTTSLGGMVLDSKGNPLDDVRVELWTRDKATQIRATATWSGKYLIDGISPGSYVVRLTRSDFATTEQLVVVGVGQNSIDLILEYSLAVAPPAPSPDRPSGKITNFRVIPDAQGGMWGFGVTWMNTGSRPVKGHVHVAIQNLTGGIGTSRPISGQDVTLSPGQSVEYVDQYSGHANLVIYVVEYLYGTSPGHGGTYYEMDRIRPST